MKKITTVKDLRAAIKKCKSVYVQPRFGHKITRWVRITKQDAHFLLKGINSNFTAKELGLGEDYDALAYISESNNILFIG